MRVPKKCFSYPFSSFFKGKLRGIKLNNPPESPFFKGRRDFFGSLKMSKCDPMKYFFVTENVSTNQI